VFKVTGTERNAYENLIS